MEEVDPVVIIDGKPSTEVMPPAIWMHNWMYSIVPGPEFSIYLVGFCKGCRTAFTAKLKSAHQPNIVIKTDIYDFPKYGCVGPS